MTTWDAILLGIIQGLTEFLPVSSSGHLELGQLLLGFTDLQNYILFNLICHLGTLCAIVYFFYPQIREGLKNKTRFIQVVVGTLPLFPLVLILKPIKAVFDEPQYLGFFFLLSSFFLFAGVYLRFGRSLIKNRWTEPLAIGMLQAVAVLPGVSRSGATISMARFLGWEKEEAINFSFLLAIPAILGGTCLELLQVIKEPSATIATMTWMQFLVGFITSFGVGCLALWLLVRMVAQNKWIYFAWYCLGLGILTLIYFNIYG
jgi:undecaprenyl-diphosphatase